MSQNFCLRNTHALTNVTGQNPYWKANNPSHNEEIPHPNKITPYYRTLFFKMEDQDVGGWTML
jgi:hypothetical protein